MLTKIVPENVAVERRFYVCEVCGAESRHKCTIAACETKHMQDSCRCKDFLYGLTSNNLITRQCIKCHVKEFKAFHKGDRKFMKKLWNML